VIRLGRISYVNMAPVFYRLDADVDEVAGVPTELNRRLLDGELDLAPISSIEYARNAERLRILPRLCVSSEGAVDSIQLVSRMPLERVRRVAVTPESATSVVLTRVLIPEAEHVPLGEEADATLLIGDAALKSAFEDPTPHYDLGRLWLERTGLPMVFAVWACQEPPMPGMADLEDALVASVRLARAEAVAQLLEIARKEAGRISVPLARFVSELLGLGACEPDRRDERVFQLRETGVQRLGARPHREDHRQSRALQPEAAEVVVRRRVLERASERGVADQELGVCVLAEGHVLGLG
jgi:chorismate dehydratase